MEISCNDHISPTTCLCFRLAELLKVTFSKQIKPVNYCIFIFVSLILVANTHQIIFIIQIKRLKHIIIINVKLIRNVEWSVICFLYGFVMCFSSFHYSGSFICCLQLILFSQMFYKPSAAKTKL